MVKLADLQPDDRNANKGTTRGAKMIEASLQEDGFGRSALLDKNNKIIAGNKTTEASAEVFGVDVEPIIVESDGTRPVYVKRTDLDLNKDVAARRLAYRDNISSHFSFDLDPEVVMADIEAGFDFEAIDVRLPDLGDMLGDKTFGRNGSEGEDTEPQIDRAEELRQQWGVELGQLWQLGEHRLICGDCTDKAVVERVMGGEVARYGMHDPPYGINVVVASDSGGDKPFGSGTIGFHGVVKTNAYKPVVNDDKPFDPCDILQASQDSILWGANYYADKLPPQKGWVVWDKKGREDWRDNFSDCELAWTSLPIVTRIFRHTWMGMVQEGEREVRVHPTQKPVALFSKMMGQLFVEEGVIIDFYLGSGTTLIACENLHRRCRAIEVDPGYVAVTLQRWADHTGKTPELLTT